MHAKKKIKQDKIIKNPESIPPAKLVNKSVNANKQVVYDYEIEIEVDKKSIIETDVEKIDVYVSKKSKQKLVKNKKVFKDVKNKKNNKDINKKILNVQKIKREDANKIQKTKETVKVSSLSLDTVIPNDIVKKVKTDTNQKLFKTKEIITVVKKDRSKIIESKEKKLNAVQKRPKDITNTKSKVKEIIKPEKKFQQQFVSSLKSGIDPAAKILKQGVKNKQTYMQAKKGIILKNNNKSFDANKKNNSISEIISKINEKNKVTSNTAYEIKRVKKVNTTAKLRKKIKLPEKLIKQAENGDINLIYVVKDKKRGTIKTIQSKINHQKQIFINNIPNFDYEIFAHRNKNNVKLKIKNYGKENSSFNVYMKEQSNVMQNRFQHYHLFENKVGIPRGKTENITRNKKIYSNKSISFRVLQVVDGIEYSNFKCTSLQSISREQSIPNGIGISAKIHETDESIQFEIKNLPSFYYLSGYQLLKRDLTKKEKTFKPVKVNKRNGNLVESKPVIVDANSSKDTILLQDDDLENNNVYEYKLLMFDKNKNKVFSAPSLIEEYEIRSGLLSLDAKIVSKKLDLDVISLTCKRSENDADKLLQSLFGNLFDLFEDDLKEIKDINDMSIVAEVVITNKENSDVIQLPDVLLKNNIEVKIDIDYNQLGIPNHHDYLVKIKPKMLPPAEILTKIKGALSNIGKKNSLKPVNSFGTAAFKSKLKDRDNEIISKTGSKFTDRSSRLKGKIIDKKTNLERTNFDFYFDGSTGDSTYIDVINASSFLPNVLNSKVNFIDKYDKNYDNIGLTIEKKYFVAQASLTNSQNVDFFMMSYKENNNTKFAGLAQPSYGSDDITKSFINYVYDLEGAIGVVEFLLMPVMKNGTKGKFISLGTKIIDSNSVRDR